MNLRFTICDLRGAPQNGRRAGFIAARLSPVVNRKFAAVIVSAAQA
jgi:hypothetical protein